MLTCQPFGRTGHLSSRVIFGAAALGSMGQERADAVLDVVLQSGINHIDTAADYGESEVRLKPFLAERRGDFFLATKTGERTGSGARRGLERSLERMGVDHVDLIQLHNLVETDEWDVAHGAAGAVEALALARDEELVRYIGVTGHGLRIARMHLRSLERFDFDTVLMPYNHVLLGDTAYRADVEELLGVCGERNVAVQTIKSVARRRWEADSSEPHFAWYEPLPPGEAFDRAVAYVLAKQQLFLISSSDARLLATLVDAASRVGGAPPSQDLDADVERFDMMPLFDGAQLERI